MGFSAERNGAGTYLALKDVREGVLHSAPKTPTANLALAKTHGEHWLTGSVNDLQRQGWLQEDGETLSKKGEELLLSLAKDFGEA